MSLGAGVVLFIILLVVAGGVIAAISMNKKQSKGPPAVPDYLKYPPAPKTFVFLSEPLGRFALDNITKSNLDGVKRQTLIRRCFRLEQDHDKTVSYSCEQAEGKEKVITAYYSTEKVYDKYIGVLGTLPENMHHAIKEHNQSGHSILCDDPEFFACTDEKGKDLTGISLNIHASWKELQEKPEANQG